MVSTKTWMARYEDDQRSKLIAVEWMPMSTEGEAVFSPGAVADPDEWNVINDNGGSWIDGQFVVVAQVQRKIR
jgi:hypothetical protein